MPTGKMQSKYKAISGNSRKNIGSMEIQTTKASDKTGKSNPLIITEPRFGVWDRVEASQMCGQSEASSSIQASSSLGKSCNPNTLH